MHKYLIAVIFVGLASMPVDTRAAADRDSLVAAWEAYMASLPSTAKFEKTAENTYQLSDTDLPYEGTLILRGALVRSSGLPEDSVFSHMGMLEFELPDLAEERLTSQIYYYWIADKQMLHYSAQSNAWVSPAEYTAEFSREYDVNLDFGFMSFMLKYGIWILLIALVIFVFRGASTQMKKNRALMDETAAINEQARENVERAKAMQDELLAITRRSLELQSENNQTLKSILDALRR